MTARTLLSLAGVEPAPPRLVNATLLLIDFQNEYREGPLALPDADAAIARTAELLAAARAAGARVIHVAHKGATDGLFDRTARRGAIVEALAPRTGEVVIEKPRPNAFSGTDLAARCGEPGADLVVAGFMTHMCVSSTVRAALDLGFRSTVAADACATRDLPGTNGTVSAAALHEAALAALGDRFAGIFSTRCLIEGEGGTADPEAVAARRS